MIRDVPDINVRKITQENARDVIERLGTVDIPNDSAYLQAGDVVFAHLLDGEPVACAGTHPSGKFTSSVGNVMVGTLSAYRKRGFGRAVIFVTTEALTDSGKIAVCHTIIQRP